MEIEKEPINAASKTPKQKRKAGTEKEPTRAATATPKQHNKVCIEKEATSSYRPPLLKPTCSKLLKDPGNGEPAGSVAAYLAMRERQKQNIAAPTVQEDVEFHQGEPTNEELETGNRFEPKIPST